MTSFTLLAKSYPGTGRPQAFDLVSREDRDRIELLEEAYGYFVVAENVEEGVDPWEVYTYYDNEGLAQWKS